MLNSYYFSYNIINRHKEFKQILLDRIDYCNKYSLYYNDIF